MSEKMYVHGYSNKEAVRLSDQAETLTDFLHSNTRYAKGCKVLESGCGVGAQTIILAQNSPLAQFTSIDISPESIGKADDLIKENNIANVKFKIADIYDLPFESENFDHIFVCFVLEHLENPLGALNNLKRVLKKDGSITLIEGDHGSTYFYPDSKEAKQVIQCQIDIQARMKGNTLIGRQMYPLLKSAGFKNIDVLPKMVYVDGSKPFLIDGFTRKTFIAMIEGVKEQAISMNLIDRGAWEKGVDDLYKTATSEGTFCYTFFKGLAIK